MIATPVLCGIAAGAATVSIGLRSRPAPARIASIANTRNADDNQRLRRRGRAKQPGRILTGMASIIVAVTAGPFAAVAVVVGAVLHQRLRSIRRRRRTLIGIAEVFPDFVDLVVLAVRAGCTPLDAITCAGHAVDGPVAASAADVTRRTLLGERFADAVALLPQQLGPLAQPLASGLSLADRYGTPLLPMLDRLADEARAQRRRNAEVSARQLPIRLSFPLAGCTLPSFVLLTVVPLMAGTLSSFRGLRRG